MIFLKAIILVGLGGAGAILAVIFWLCGHELAAWVSVGLGVVAGAMTVEVITLRVRGTP